MGYSFGGGAALQLAFQQPALVRRLIVVSAPYSRGGFFPEMLPQQAAVGAAMADAMKETPMYKAYAAIAPRPQDFPRLLDARTPSTWIRRTTSCSCGTGTRDRWTRWCKASSPRSSSRANPG